MVIAFVVKVSMKTGVAFWIIVPAAALVAAKEQCPEAVIPVIVTTSVVAAVVVTMPVTVGLQPVQLGTVIGASTDQPVGVWITCDSAGIAGLPDVISISAGR